MLMGPVKSFSPFVYFRAKQKLMVFTLPGTNIQVAFARLLHPSYFNCPDMDDGI